MKKQSMLNLGERLYVHHDGTRGRVTTMLDGNGDETEDPNETVIAVVALHDKFVIVEVNEFSPVTWH